MPRYRFILLLCLAVVAPATAQDRPAALLQRWAEEQTARYEAVERFAVLEDAVWMLDGPHARRRMRIVSHLAGILGAGELAREVQVVEFDGRDIAPERWAAFERRRRSLAGVETESLTQGVFQFPAVLRDVRPLSAPSEDPVDGESAWRFNLAPREPNGPVEQITLWLSAEGRLLRTRAVVRRPPPPEHERGWQREGRGPARRQGQHQLMTPTPFVVTTEYVRIGGLDVPQRRRIEGIIQRKRRERFFSMLFEYEAGYQDYRIERAP